MHFVLWREPYGPVTNSEFDEKGNVFRDYIQTWCSYVQKLMHAVDGQVWSFFLFFFVLLTFKVTVTCL